MTPEKEQSQRRDKKILVGLLALLVLLVASWGIAPAVGLAYSGTASDFVTVASNEPNGEVGAYNKYNGNNGQAWCAYFVAWCARQAGVTTEAIPNMYGCANLVNYYQQRGRWHSYTYTPNPGDLIFYSGTNGGSAAHVGIVTGVSGGYVHTKEGNTHPSNGGGWVWSFSNRRVGSNGFSGWYIIGYASPAFTSASTPAANKAKSTFDTAVGGEGTITVTGWAFDPNNSSASCVCDFYVGGTAGSGGVGVARVNANLDSPDVNRAYGISGKHRFSATFETTVRGKTRIFMHPVICDLSANERSFEITVTEPKKGATTSINSGTYVIHSCSNLSRALDVDGSSNANNANVQISNCHGGANQQFRLSKSSQGFYTIQAVHSGKNVEVAGARLENSANVSQYSPNGGTCQEWWIDKNSDGTYSFRNRWSGKCLDKVNGDSSNETNVQQYAPNSSAAQKWYLVPTSYTDVNSDTSHSSDIAYTTNAGVSFGWGNSDGSRYFKPYDTVKRADMAAFLYRLGVKWGKVGMNWTPTDAQKQAFSDVNSSTPHAKEIWWLASTGISTGWDKNGYREFRPNSTVLRQDMAAFIFRLAKLGGKGGASDSWSADGASQGKFVDVSSSTPHAREVWWLASKGVSAGWNQNGRCEFRGGKEILRCDMAAFLKRTDNL